MATIIEKRLQKVWNSALEQWVEVYNPTSADIVTLTDTRTVEAAIGTLETDLQTHSMDTDLHKTSTDRTKLSNLPTDANGTFATQSALATHAADTTLHKTADEQLVLDDLMTLPDDALPSEHFATKAELAGVALIPIVVADITERDGLQDLQPGQQVWVQDPTDDTDNISEAGAALYLWDGTTWHFIVQMGGGMEIIHDWDSIVNKPTVLQDANLAALATAVANSHTHSNKAVLDKLDVDLEDNLTFDGEIVGKVYSTIFMQSGEPADPNPNDLWFAPIV